MENALLNESQLRHPWEKTIFVVSVVLNVALMVGAVIMVRTAHDWLKDYPFIAKNTKQIQALAIAAIFALPAIALIRNNRRGFIRGNAVRLSNDQIPEIFNILEGHCKSWGWITCLSCTFRTALFTSLFRHFLPGNTISS
jgi:hypothetical protein